MSAKATQFSARVGIVCLSSEERLVVDAFGADGVGLEGQRLEPVTGEWFHDESDSLEVFDTKVASDLARLLRRAVRFHRGVKGGGSR